MPVYIFTDNKSGVKYRVNASEGASEEDAWDYFSKEYEAGRLPVEEEKTSIRDLARGLQGGLYSGVSGGLKGLAGLTMPVFEGAAYLIGGKAPSLENAWLYKAGQFVEDVSKGDKDILGNEYAPVSASVQNKLPYQLASGAGQIISQLAGGAAGKAVSYGLGVGTGAGNQVDDYADSVKQEDRTATGALGSALAGGAIGSLEALPIERVFGRFGEASVNRAINLGKQALMEGGQEYASTVLQNLYAKEAYDSDRNLVENAADSGIVGGVLGGVIGAALPGKAKPKLVGVEEAPPVSTEEILPDSETEVNQAQARLDEVQSQLEKLITAKEAAVNEESKKLIDSSIKKLQAKADGIPKAMALRADAIRMRALGNDELADQFIAKADKYDPPEDVVKPKEGTTTDKGKVEDSVAANEAGGSVYSSLNQFPFVQGGSGPSQTDVAEGLVAAPRERLSANDVRPLEPSENVLESSVEPTAAANEDYSRKQYEEDLAYKQNESKVKPAPVTPTTPEITNPAMAQALQKALSQKASREKGFSPNKWKEGLVTEDGLTVAEEQQKIKQEEAAFTAQENLPTPQEMAEIEQDINENDVEPFRFRNATQNRFNPLPVREMDRRVKEITGSWKNAPPIVVYDGDLSFPPAIQSRIEGTNGFYHKGTVYVNAQKFSSDKELAKTIFHETLGHAGLRGSFGDSFNGVLDSLYPSLKKEVATKAKDYGLDVRDVNQLREATEEVLAEMAQKNPSHSAFRKAIAKIRRWLRETFPNVKALQFLSNAEIVETFIIPSANYIKKGREASLNENTDVNEIRRQLTPKQKETINDVKNKAKEIGTTVIGSKVEKLRMLADKYNQPVVRELADALYEYVDIARKLHGDVNKYFRENDALFAKDKELAGLFEQYQYLERVDKKAAQELYDKSSKDFKTIIKNTRDFLDHAADAAIAAGVLEKGRNGRYTLFRKLKNYFPLMLKPEYRAALNSPDEPNNREVALEIAQMLSVQGRKIGNRVMQPTIADLKLYLNAEYAAFRDVGSVFGNMEFSRSAPFPAKMYDTSYNSILHYKNAWAERLAQIEAFGQGKGQTNTGEKADELFNKALNVSKGSSSNLHNYIEELAENVYGTYKQTVMSKAMATAGTITNAVLLANPVSIETNFIGSMGLNYSGIPVKNMNKAFVDLQKEAASFVEWAKDIGVVRDDLNQMAFDASQLGASETAVRLSTNIMKKTGYMKAEEMPRVIGAIGSKYYLKDGMEAIATNPNSHLAKRFQLLLNRYKLDKDKLLQGDVEEANKFIRRHVNALQGSYTHDSVGLWSDTPNGRFMFKYWKFSLQTGRALATQVNDSIELLKQAKTTEDKLKAAEPVLRHTIAMLLSGDLINMGKAAIFGTVIYQGLITNIAKALFAAFEGEEEEAVDLITRLPKAAYYAMVASGGLSLIGQFSEAIDRTGKYTEGKTEDYVASQMPPTLSWAMDIVDQFAYAAKTGVFEGKNVQHNIEKMLQKIVPAFIGWKKLAYAGVDSYEFASDTKFPWNYAADNADVHAMKAQRNAIRIYTEEYMKEKDIGTSKSKGGEVTERTPVKQQLIDQLYLGRPEAARAIIRGRASEELKEANTLEKKKEIGRSLSSAWTGSVRYAHPIAIGDKNNAENRTEFLKWYMKRVNEEQYNEVVSLVKSYETTAYKAGVLQDRTTIPIYRK